MFLFVIVEYLFEFLFQFLSIDISGYDGTVGGKEDGMRKGINSIERSGDVLSIDDLWIWDAEVADGLFCLFWLVAEGDTKHRQPFLLVLLIEADQVGYLLSAWATLRSPEVGKYILAASHIVREACGLSVVLNGKVFEHLALFL